MSQCEDSEINLLIERVCHLDLEQCNDEMLVAIHDLERLAEQRGSDVGLAAARYFLACQKHATLQKSEALTIALEAVEFARNHGLSYYETHAHNICGIIFEDLADYSASLDHYLTAYHLAMHEGQEDYAPYLLVNVGNLFMVLDDFNTALPYLLDGFDGFTRISAPTPRDRANTATIVLNIIEAYTGCGNYSCAMVWIREQRALLEEYKMGGIADCFLLIGDARKSLDLHDHTSALHHMHSFLDLASRSEDFGGYFTINLHLSALDIAIILGDQALADLILAFLEHTSKKSSLSAFDYKLESYRIRYYDRFYGQDPRYLQAKEFFYPYYQISCSTIQMLHQTYAESLNMRTELNRARDEQQSILDVNRKLKNSIELDPFTGIYNKVSVRAHVEKCLNSWRDGRMAAMLLVDIDNFKNVNDSYGHQEGDRIIASVANLLKGTFRRSDVLGRVGGDEFLVFLPDLSGEEAARQNAERLLSNIKQLSLPDQPMGGLTLSIGMALALHPESYDSFFAQADQALYTAKLNGRGRYEIYSEKERF